MLNQNSLEEIADIYNLLGDIKTEYEEGIKPILVKNSPKLFKNPHSIPKLKKISHQVMYEIFLHTSHPG